MRVKRLVEMSGAVPVGHRLSWLSHFAICLEVSSAVLGCSHEPAIESPPGPEASGGECANGGGPIVLVNLPYAQVVDLRADGVNVYWSDYSGNIFSVAKCGGHVSRLATVDTSIDGGSWTSSNPPVLSLGAASVFFLAGTTIGKVGKSGGLVEELGSDPYGLAGWGFTVSGNEVYWMNQPPNGASSLDGVGADGGAPVVVASGLSGARFMLAQGSDLIWAGWDGTINKMPLAGGAVTTLAVGQTKPSGLAVSATDVFWSVDGSCSEPVSGPPCPPPVMTASAVRRVSIAGGMPTVVANEYEIVGVAVDGANVFWTYPYDSVRFTPAAGGPSASIAGTLGVYVGPVLDQDSVYWVAAVGGAGSQIMRVAKPTGP
jgi:hypothetical protein